MNGDLNGIVFTYQMNKEPLEVCGVKLENTDLLEARAVAYYFYRKYKELQYSINVRKHT
jgi:hypothetical protein